MEQLNQSNPVDPSTLENTSAKPLVDDSPQTAANQEAPPESITNEMSKQAGETMGVNDNLWSSGRNLDQTEHGKPKEDSFNHN